MHADLTSLRQHFEPSALLLEYGGEAAVLGAMQSEGMEEAAPPPATAAPPAVAPWWRLAEAAGTLASFTRAKI